MQTAHTSTFMLYELSKHPEVQEKLRHEVVSVLGESGEADAESLQKMPYLIQVIRETQRSLITACAALCVCCVVSLGIVGAGCFLVVVAQWQSTGCTCQVSWVRFPALPATFFYFAS